MTTTLPVGGTLTLSVVSVSPVVPVSPVSPVVSVPPVWSVDPSPPVCEFERGSSEERGATQITSFPYGREYSGSARLYRGRHHARDEKRYIAHAPNASD